jgi:arginine decarboxylase
MKNTYFDLIEQSYYFPQEGFDLRDGGLTFHGISLKYLIKKYGTPFRFIYLPKIGDQIKKARNLFNKAIKKNNYKGNYHYCYCTKCNHFSHVILEALKHNVNLETSSAYDIDLILNLFREKKIDKNRVIVHNGYKTDEYLAKILNLQEIGFKNNIIVLDSINELNRIEKLANGIKVKIGIRMAINE